MNANRLLMEGKMHNKTIDTQSGILYVKKIKQTNFTKLITAKTK